MALRAELDFHSRLIFWLKILLPLAALAILSTLFLFSRGGGVEGLLPFSEVEVEELAREQRVTAPQFSGVTTEGDGIVVRARTARPAIGDSIATVDEVTATLTRTDGATATVSADKGSMDTEAGILSLDGRIMLRTSDGYALDSDAMVMKLDRTSLVSPGPVKGNAPFGTLQAGRMALSAETPGALPSGLVFDRGVRMVYTPQEEAAP